MKRVIYFVLVITLLLAGCAPATEISAPTSDVAVNPSETSTKIPALIATKAPTKTPIIPTATFIPLEVVPISANPLTLTEFNAGTEMKRLNVIGTGTAHDLEFSPDGTRLAVATGRGIYLYDGSTFEQNGFIDVNDSIEAIAFSPDGNILAIAVDGIVNLWNVNSGQQMMSLDGGMVYIYKLAYAVGGYVAAIGGTCRGCGSQQGGMILWSSETGHQIFSERDIWYATKALAFTSDGKSLFFGGQDGLSIIKTETGQEVKFDRNKFGFPSTVNSPGDFIFNNDETKLFITDLGEDGDIVDIDTQTRELFPLCDTYLARSNMNGVCPLGQGFVIFDLSNGEEVDTVDTEKYLDGWNGMFALSPDSRYLAYGIEHFVSIYDTQTKQSVKNLEFTNFDNLTTGMVLIDGNEKYVVAVENPPGQISLFDLQNGDKVRTLSLECCEIDGFNFAPDRKTFVTIETRSLKFWDLRSSHIIYEIILKNDYSGPIAFSPDGNSIFLTDASEIIELDLRSGKTINHGHNSYDYVYADPYAVENYHFNSFGNLVTLSYEKSAGDYYPSFYDEVTNEKIIIPYNAYSDPLFIEAFSLSSDGQYIAFGNPTETLVWDIASMKLQSKFIGHERRSGDGWYGRIKYLKFSPHSNLLVSVGWDETIRLWSPRFGNELRRLNACCSADFTPDGRYLITYGNGVAYVWGIPQ